MGRIVLFFKSMFSELGSGLSGPASIPFAVAALWVSSPVQRMLYASLAGILLLVSAYRIWAKERTRADNAESDAATLKQKYFDERPMLGLEINGPKGPKAWRDASSSDACWFWLQLLSGRTPRSIRFDPIHSKNARFILQFDEVSYLEPSPRRASLVYHVREAVLPALSAHDREKLGDIEAKMLGMFLDDSPPGLVELRYTLTVRFKDREDEERTRNFNIVFDKSTFSFLPNTD